MSNTRCEKKFNCEECVKSDVCPNKRKASELIEQFADQVCGYPFNASLSCWSYLNKSNLITEIKGVNQLKKKNLYGITYQACSICIDIIVAKSPEQAIRKFHRKHSGCWDVIDIKIIQKD